MPHLSANDLKTKDVSAIEVALSDGQCEKTCFSYRQQKRTCDFSKVLDL